MKPFTVRTMILATALMITVGYGCLSGKPNAGAEISYTPEFVKQQIEANETLLDENAALTDEIKELKLAGCIQSDYAKRGENKSYKLVRETVREAFKIAYWYSDNTELIPESLSPVDFAYYLITFSGHESNFNPMLESKKGDSGICQTLKKDYPRLSRKARKRGLEFKDDIKNIRTGLICCAEEFFEKLEITHGDIQMACWKYNGNKSYLKLWRARYAQIREFAE